MAESHVDDDWALHFQDGVDAYFGLKRLADNPHPVGTQAANEWAAGWDNAREEMVEREEDYDGGAFVWGGWTADTDDYGDEAA